MHPLLKQPTVHTNRQAMQTLLSATNGRKKTRINCKQLQTHTYAHVLPHTHKQTVILIVKTAISQNLVNSLFELKLRDCTVPHELAQFVKQTKMFVRNSSTFGLLEKAYSQAFHLTIAACVLFVSVCFCGSSLRVGERLDTETIALSIHTTVRVSVFAGGWAGVFVCGVSRR